MSSATDRSCRTYSFYTDSYHWCKTIRNQKKKKISNTIATMTSTPNWDDLCSTKSIFDRDAPYRIPEVATHREQPPLSTSTTAPQNQTAITLYEAGKLDKTFYAMVHIKRVNFLEEALKAGLPIWMEVSAMSSLSLKCVLTDGLGRDFPSVYAKGLIPLMTRACNEILIFPSPLFNFLAYFFSFRSSAGY